MSHRTSPTRRDLLTTGVAGIAAAAVLPTAALAEDRSAAAAAKPDGRSEVAKNGRINHSVCLWCYNGMTPADIAPVAGRLGLKAIDLLTPDQWGPLKEHGLVCSMTSHPEIRIEVGLNRRENHERLIKALREGIDASAAAGYPNVICFSGNRHLPRKNGDAPLESRVSDEEGIKVCAEGLKRVMAHAEQKKVNVVMELLNSKVDHADYMCDHSAWGVELCKAVGSERFKLLYDIYHMQIMEGDVIRTIRDNHQYFGHYHTGGVPGRHEIDETQELNWPAIMRAIVDTGFTGYVAQEFIPAKPDRIASLAAAVQVCDV
jgi:hydroxypyruvate isomerase